MHTYFKCTYFKNVHSIISMVIKTENLYWQEAFSNTVEDVGKFQSSCVAINHTG